MFLYAGGCSMTFGSEMLHPDDMVVLNDPELNAQRIALAWPGQLEKILNFSGHHNDGVAGASNEMILRNTVMWILKEWIGKGKSPDDLFVMINWSQNTRWEFFSNHQYHQLFANREPIEEHNTQFKRFWLKFIAAGCGNKSMSWRKFVVQVNQLQSFLESSGIRYGMSYGVLSPRTIIDSLFWKSNTEESMKFFRDTETINKRRFLGFLRGKMGMCEVIYRAGIEPEQLAPRGHPYANGHKIWADFLAQWILEYKLMD